MLRHPLLLWGLLFLGGGGGGCWKGFLHGTDAVQKNLFLCLRFDPPPPLICLAYLQMTVPSHYLSFGCEFVGFGVGFFC